MQTMPAAPMSPSEWPPPAVPEPPAPKPSRAKWAWVILAFLVGAAILGASSNASSEGVPSTYRYGSGSSSATYTYSHGDYPNGWTQSQVDESISGLVAADVPTDMGACLMRYVIDHFTPSEFLASDPPAVARRAVAVC